MVIEMMTHEECEELLARKGAGRLACAQNNQPYIVPIYFGHQSHRLYGFATLGKKIEWLRTNPRVCVQVDEIADQDDWQSVIVQGDYEELPDIPQYASERHWAQGLLHRRNIWWGPAFAVSQVREPHRPVEPIFYCIHVREMTGMRASPGERITETFHLKS